MNGIRWIVLVIFCTMMHCSMEQLAGGCTETTNSAKVYNPDGTSAKGVSILVMQTGNDPRITPPVDTLYTDSIGCYYSSMLKDGNYSFLFSQDTLLAKRDSVVVADGEGIAGLRDTLTVAGSAKGIVRLRPEHSVFSIYLLLTSSNIFTVPIDSTGNFFFPKLAPGKYRLRVLSTISGYDILDTLFFVKGSTTTNIVPLRLTYNLLVPPADVQIALDTMQQLIRLSWNAVPVVAVRGYQIARRTVRDQNGVWRILTTTAVNDTTFIDSSRWKSGNAMLVDGDSCFYRIAAVDTLSICGKFSLPQKIFLRSPWQIRKTIPVRTGVNLDELESSLCQGTDGMLYAAWSDSSWVYRIDPVSQVVERAFYLGRGITISDLISMPDSTFIIAGGSLILRVSETGSILRTYPVQVKRIALVNNNLLCVTVADLPGSFPRAVDNLTLSTGQTVRRYKSPVNNSISSITHTGNLLCMFERDKNRAFGLYAVEPSGASVKFKTEEGEEEFAVSKSRIALLSGMSIRMLSYSDTMITESMDRFGVPPDAIRLVIIDDQNVCVLCRDGRIRVLSKKQYP